MARRRNSPIPPTMPIAGTPPKLYSLFDTDSHRLKGWRSYPTPTSLPADVMAEMSNVRLDDGLITIRPACGNQSAFPWTGTANYRGSAVFEVAGVLWYFVAIGLNTGEGIDIYAGTNVGFLNKITGDQKYNATMPTDITDGYVNFAVVYSKTADKYYVIAQNGRDAPLVHALSAAAQDTAPVNPVIVPEGADGYAPMPCFDGILHANTNSALFTSTAQANINWQAIGNLGDKALKCTINPTVNIGDSAIFYINTGLILDFTYLAPRRQVIIFYSTNDDSFWDKVDVYLVQATGTGPFYKVSTDDTFPVRGPLDNSGMYKYIAFSVDAVNIGPQINGVIGLKIEWKALNRPLFSMTCTVYGVVRSGNVPGGTDFALTYMNSGSQAESRGVFLPPPMAGQKLSAYFLQPPGSAGTDINRINVPVIEGLYYCYRINAKMTTNAELQKGVDRINIYRRDPGALDYYYVATRLVSTYNTSTHVWQPQWPAETFGTQSLLDTTPFSAVDVSRPCPDAFQKCLPKGTAMLYANNRLYVGGRASTARAESTILYVSEDRNPFRFREEVRYNSPSSPDLTSAVRNDMGNEIIQAFQDIPGGAPGLSTVLMWTNHGLYLFDGFDAYSLSRPRRISDSGTNSPWSIATDEQTIYWLDQQMRVRMRSGGSEIAISRLRVDDKLLAIPPASRRFAAGVAMQNRYLLAYTRPGDAGNRYALVYNQISGEFESNDYYNELPATGVGRFHKIIGSTAPISLAAWTAGFQPQLWQMFDPTVTQQQVVLNMTTRELHNHMWEPFKVGRMGIVCSDMAAEIITNRTVKPTTGSTTGSINLDGPNAYTWRWDLDDPVNQGNVRAQGLTAQFQYTGFVPPGGKIYSLVVELWDASSSPDGPDIKTP